MELYSRPPCRPTKGWVNGLAESADHRRSLAGLFGSPVLLHAADFGWIHRAALRMKGLEEDEVGQVSFECPRSQPRMQAPNVCVGTERFPNAGPVVQ